LQEFIPILKNELSKDSFRLTEQQKQDTKADILTIESQLMQSKPKRSVITDSAQTLFDSLKETVGSETLKLIKAISVIAGIA
jgi:hypothetical protein|tara:strand:+ start:192 stop:437 length:246 start_codon:yes stop_codon:yes gene_type:complete